MLSSSGRISAFLGSEMPRVVNLKKMVADDWMADTLYIGRPGKLTYKMLAAHPEMGDGSGLGNPFKAENYDSPEDCLRDYRRWLDERIRPRSDLMEKKGMASRAALESIKPTTLLVCWCKPEPCHGDVVVKAWEWIQRQGRIRPSRPLLPHP